MILFQHINIKSKQSDDDKMAHNLLATSPEMINDSGTHGKTSRVRGVTESKAYKGSSRLEEMTKSLGENKTDTV